MATNITGDSKQEKQKLSIGNIASAFKNVGSNFKEKFSKAPKITFGKGMTGTSSPFTSGTDPSKITDSLNETNRILVEIQNQLAIDFANRIAESKDQLKANKRAINDQKRTDKENKLESKWLSNALGQTGKALQGVDKSLGNVLGVKGGLFGTVFKGLGLLFAGAVGLTAWRFFQNPDNIKRLGHFFTNIGEYTTKAIDWVKTTWANLKPKINLLQNLPFSDMYEAKLWIQHAVYELFPGWMQRWMKDPLQGYRELQKATGDDEYFKEFIKNNRLVRNEDDTGWNVEYDKPTQEWIIKELGFKKGGYTGALGGIVHPKEFVFNSDAVNEWGVNLLSSMNEGRAPLEALVTNKALQLGKVPRRTIIENIDLPDITQPKTDNRLNNSPVASIPSYSSINPFDTDIAKAPIHYGFAEFI